MEFDHYVVSCVQDAKGGERFSIRFVNQAEGRPTSMIGPFTETECHAEMEKMGLPKDRIEDNIRRARENVDTP
jgi:hypothetical protein